MATISQGLPVPPGLADGQVASASQITPLYTAMNAFVVPDSINLGIMKPALIDNSLTVLATGGTKDWALTANTIPIDKFGFFIISFAFGHAGGTPFRIAYRINGTTITDPISGQLSSLSGGGGVVVGFIGGHDADTAQSNFMALQIDSGPNFKPITNFALTPAGPITSIGVTVSNAAAGPGNFMNFKYAKFYTEG